MGSGASKRIGSEQSWEEKYGSQAAGREKNWLTLKMNSIGQKPGFGKKKLFEA